LFGGGRSRRSNYNGPQKGASVRINIRVTFEEAIFGCEKEVELNMKDPCEKCNATGAKPGSTPVSCTKCGGSGQVVMTTQSLFGMVRNVQTCPDCKGKGKIIKDKCPDCYGTGYISNRKTIKIAVPAGIDDEQTIRIAGKGEPGINGGERGDLLVEVSVSRHPIYQRQGTNIYSTVPISFTDAALGNTIRIKTVHGEVEYDLKAGTQTDTRIRLRGKGVPSIRNNQVKGDHYVTFVVQVPEKLTDEQREALEAFAEAMGGESPKKDKKNKKGLFK
jgi:molecular chaperone DnaJ